MDTTKEKILNAAQRLIAEQGYAATSVRHIVAEAGVNLAAIHYHFGTKEDLLDAVITRKKARVNAERLAQLDAVAARAGSAAPPVRDLLAAFLAPMAEAADRDPEFVRLMGRMMAEGLLMTIMHKHLQVAVDRFLGLLQRALPKLSDDEYRWRVHFMFGAMSHTMMSGRTDITGVGGDTRDFRGRVQRLITFLTAGFETAATPAYAPAEPVVAVPQTAARE